MNTGFHKACYAAALVSIVALIVLCTLWEVWLAPLRPGGSWLALKALPLLWPLRGVIKRDIYTMQWSAMLVLLYFVEGVVRGTSVTGIDQGASAMLAWGEVSLSTLFFFGSIFYLRPFKQAAKRLAQEAIQKAAKSNTYK
ncbi:MAG TPA: DUF2069 domain-containing protein [Noviherbaspirillum sp.]|nr:DUF2069 domain-containing protein [Noviherbaspirillum sp.]